MNYFETLIANRVVPFNWMRCVLVLVVAAGLTACGSKEKKDGQSLVRVDNDEITVLQLNEELQRANVSPSQQEAASKQLLESMIDRQLIIAEAVRNKVDRSPEVVQAIERAKAQIIAQAYLQGKTASLAKPTKAEIDDYFQKHPDFFSKRKQFDMLNVLISTKDFNDELKAAMAPAKSMDEVMAWMDRHQVQYKRGRLSRTSADLPPEMSAKLLNLPKGHLFIVNEGENTMLISLVAIKDSPVSVSDAAPQIAEYLYKSKVKEVANTEIAHLRSLAKIVYLNASAPVAASAIAPASDMLTRPETKPAGGL